MLTAYYVKDPQFMQLELWSTNRAINFSPISTANMPVLRAANTCVSVTTAYDAGPLQRSVPSLNWQVLHIYLLE